MSKMLLWTDMQRSEYRQKKVDKLKAKAVRLYKSGYTFREVSNALKVSHEWVRQAYLSTLKENKLDIN